MMNRKFNLVFLQAILTFTFSSIAFAGSIIKKEIPEATCKEIAGSPFKPCICADKVPTTIKYRPSLAECGGKAAAILSGQFATSYSVVLRDKGNRDRWPASGYNGCTSEETSKGLNKCSAFKCQKILKRSTSSVTTGAQQICCFGEKGTNQILGGASRLTIKLQDVPNSSSDPLVRVCLNGYKATKNLN